MTHRNESGTQILAENLNHFCFDRQQGLSVVKVVCEVVEDVKGQEARTVVILLFIRMHIQRVEGNAQRLAKRAQCVLRRRSESRRKEGGGREPDSPSAAHQTPRTPPPHVPHTRTRKG